MVKLQNPQNAHNDFDTLNNDTLNMYVPFFFFNFSTLHLHVSLNNTLNNTKVH